MTKEQVERVMGIRAELDKLEDELIAEERGEFLAGHAYSAKGSIDQLLGEWWATEFKAGRVTFTVAQEG